MKIARSAATAAAILALGFTAAPAAQAVAANPPGSDTAPCAKQQSQLDKAEAKLATLTSKLASKKDAIAEAKAQVKASETAQAKRSARAAVASAKAKKQHVKKAKKAQVQRVAHAQKRLDACTAKNPVAPTPPPPAA